MDKKLLQSINKRLGVIVALLVQSEQIGTKSPPLRKQIKALHGLGLEPKEIAHVLSRSRIYVNKEISELRKAKTKKS